MSIALSPHIREFKKVPDSGFHTVDSGFQSPGSRIRPSIFPRFHEKKDFRNSEFRFPCMARALSFRQIRLLSFSSQKSRTISREYSQIISTSRWVKKVELYTSMLTCISQNGNDLLILETEDSTIEPALLGLTCTQS